MIRAGPDPGSPTPGLNRKSAGNQAIWTKPAHCQPAVERHFITAVLAMICEKTGLLVQFPPPSLNLSCKSFQFRDCFNVPCCKRAPALSWTHARMKSSSTNPRSRNWNRIDRLTSDASLLIAAADLLSLVYDELRKLAAARIAAEQPGHTVDATALVHEAYRRLVGDSDPGAHSRTGRGIVRGNPIRR